MFFQLLLPLPKLGFKIDNLSAYAPQVNNSMEEKNDFWQDLHGLTDCVSKKKQKDSSRCGPKWTCRRRKHKR